MNASLLSDDNPSLGVYTRAIGSGAEWWRVSLSERAFMYRIEHGRDDGSVDIDTVVDQENLDAKLQKWHREGYLSEAQREQLAAAPQASADFMADLARASNAFAQSTVRAARLRSTDQMVTIGRIEVPLGAPNPLVPAVNPAWLFTERFNDIIEDVVENRRVMLIGHTGSGKTSLIEQIAARAQYGVLRSNMNGQTTVGDFVGFWTVKGGETVWVDGVLPAAMREGRWLIVDEVDFAEPAILAVLTAVLEPGGRLLLKEKGNDIVEPHPSFRLFATANAVGAMSQFRHLYQGANLMNEAFLDRWRVYLIDYLSPDEEADVLMRTLAPHLSQTMAHTLAAIAADCRAAFAREDLASAFSTRRLLDWAQLMLRTGDPERAAGPAIYAKVSPEDAALIRSIIRHYIATQA
ncbi:AAA family ATPase [Paraburkholderia acidicola]|uniref:AAA family ATPase n=1 Tax=Paraburkholderia acidicola TaxID=1912599 RepID=A0ABV1LRK0_9BURK